MKTFIQKVNGINHFLLLSATLLAIVGAFSPVYTMPGYLCSGPLFMFFILNENNFRHLINTEDINEVLKYYYIHRVYPAVFAFLILSIAITIVVLFLEYKKQNTTLLTFFKSFLCVSLIVCFSLIASEVKWYPYDSIPHAAFYLYLLSSLICFLVLFCLFIPLIAKVRSKHKTKSQRITELEMRVKELENNSTEKDGQ